MQTIEVSDSMYKEILSRRKGRESISKTLERELKPTSASRNETNVKKVDDMVRETNKEKTYTSKELRARYGV
jgi:negative regulator of replication initiation